MSGCGLCPRRCGARRDQGERGFCGAGPLVRVGLVSLHQWEEPPLSGSRGSGTVFFSGCSLGCVYCQNRAVSRGRAGKDVSVERLAEIFCEQQDRGAHNLNLVTADHYIPQVLAALDMAKTQGFALPVVWNCSGYQSTSSLELLAGAVDIWLADFKYWDPLRAARYSQAPDYPEIAWAAAQEMVRQQPEAVFDGDGLLRRGVIFRHLLLPGGLEDSRQVLEHLFSRFGNRVWYSLMSQYTPMPGLDAFPELRRRVTAAEYDELVDFCVDLGMENAFVQEGEAAAESFIPEFDGRGV
ncbi:MAG: 4Fe-4S cluster-binding domain-containing protein [Firmicutes bacterium]|nr:4Fe-4S cluster-binding domain-containing protein [Bacillota bacterium]